MLYAPKGIQLLVGAAVASLPVTSTTPTRAYQPQEGYVSWLDALCAPGVLPSAVLPTRDRVRIAQAAATTGGTGGFVPDARVRPGNASDGSWAGLISPPDPVSNGPALGQWITKAGLPTSRSEVAVAESGGHVYVLGGYANGLVDQPLVEDYDPVGDTWRRRADLPKGGNHLTSIGVGGKVYAFGGFSRQNHAAYPESFVFDPASDRWSTIAPLPMPLASMAAAVLDGKIHLVGGATGTTFETRRTVDVHYVYDPATDAWSEGPKLPFPREHLNLIAFENKLYAIGGRVENFSQNMATVYLLDPADKTPAWKALPLMPTARSGTQAALLNDKIFVFGGEKFGGVFNVTEMFDPRTLRWSTLTPMPIGRHGTGAVTIGDAIYIPAGGPLNGGAAQTNANQAFTYP